MLPFTSILAPTDASLCAESAMQHALFLGRRAEAPVHRLRVHPVATPAPPSPSALPQGVLEQTVYHDDPAAAILAYARAQAAGLLVLGAHGDRGQGRILSQGVGTVFLGRTAGQVVRHAACPVLTVRLGQGRAPADIRRIVVAVDGSRLARAAVAWAQALAGLYQAQLEMLHVVEHSEVSPGHEAEQAALRASNGTLPEAPRMHVVSGRPARAILAFARHPETSLLVVGAHTDRRTDRLGSVAAEVVRAAPCAVLTVRTPPGVSSDLELARQAPRVRSTSVG